MASSLPCSKSWKFIILKIQQHLNRIGMHDHSGHRFLTKYQITVVGYAEFILDIIGVEFHAVFGKMAYDDYFVFNQIL